jgi:putative membrane protein
MKKLFIVIPTLFLTTSLLAADATTPPSWHAQTMGGAIANVLIFAAIGIATAIVGYKVFDLCTPGHLEREIIENKNVAAAIVAAAAILGVSIIIAACMLG